MVINNIVAKANHIANRILGDRVYNKVFGYRNIPEYRMLRNEFINIKNSAKKTFKDEAKWLRISSNGLLRVELVFLEEKYLEYLELIKTFQKRLDDVLDAANNAPIWVDILRCPAAKLLEILYDHLASLEMHLDALDAYDKVTNDSYSMTFTEFSSSSSMSSLLSSLNDDSSLRTVSSESSLSVASATSGEVFDPLFMLKNVDVDDIHPVFDLQVINCGTTAQCC